MLLLANPATPLVNELTGSSLPLVAMVDAITGVASVLANEEKGAELLVGHLQAQGCRRILWRGWAIRRRNRPGGVWSASPRHAALGTWNWY